MNIPVSITFDAAMQNYYVAERGNNRVIKYNMTENRVTLVAGTGMGGKGDEGVLATAAPLTEARYAVPKPDNSGVFISDASNNRVRYVNASGYVSTFAGRIDGSVGSYGHGVPAVDTAALNFPRGLVWVSAVSTLFIADASNNAIRKVDSSGIITTVAGMLGQTCTFVNGSAATSTCLSNPETVAVSSDGARVWIPNAGSHRVVKVENSIMTLVAGVGGTGSTGDGGLAILAKLASPSCVAVDATESMMWISDTENHVIRVVGLRSGIISHVAGIYGDSAVGADIGDALSVSIGQPEGVAVTSDGSQLFVTSYMHHNIRRLILPTPSSTPSTSPSVTSSPSPSPTQSSSPTGTGTPSRTPSYTASGTSSNSGSATPSSTPSTTSSSSRSSTPSITASATSSTTASHTPSQTYTPTTSFTPTSSVTATATPSAVWATRQPGSIISMLLWV
ncbi:MAG: hypothetical protein EOO65_02630 [Methanosarcinales archaeon]|nr:MAG: hypothetical protein EOO65_02630 [Methanosarcinales archaeon]